MPGNRHQEKTAKLFYHLVPIKDELPPNDETSQLGERIQQLEQVRSQTHPKLSAQSSTNNTETNYQKNLNTTHNLEKGTTPNVNEMLK